jgi:hypothetical protein
LPFHYKATFKKIPTEKREFHTKGRAHENAGFKELSREDDHKSD